MANVMQQQKQGSLSIFSYSGKFFSPRDARKISNNFEKLWDKMALGKYELS